LKTQASEAMRREKRRKRGRGIERRCRVFCEALRTEMRGADL
jgi:hypothetical protein